MFISNTKEDKEEMLKEIGVSSFAELVKQVPSKLLNPKINLPAALEEHELRTHLEKLGAKNKKVLNFIGAGAYEHFVPAAVPALAGRGEFVTAYTPYQPEASQGTLQAIYEYQSAICALFAMAATNASMYDGASALAEAVNAALKAMGKAKVLIPFALHPHYKETLKTYFAPNPSVKFEEIPCADGVICQKSLEKMLAADTAAVILSQPNFYGNIEDAQAISDAAHKAGALLISLNNPISLGALVPPGEYGADFAVAEGQPLGNPLNYGGPYLGILAASAKYTRYLPGRICGITKDHNGKRGFVLTLQAREQHIRREKAQSNICSNEALCALQAGIHIALLGPQGLKEVAELNIEAAHKTAEKLTAIPGFKLKYKAPFFNEFVLETPIEGNAFVKQMAQKGILAGYPLGGISTELKNCVLVCATETKTSADIERFASIAKECALAKEGVR